MEKLIKKIDKLTDKEKLILINKCSNNNNEILYISLFTKEYIIKEILYLNEDDCNKVEIINWLSNTNSNIVFEIVKKHCDKKSLYDLENFNSLNESLLTYIKFDCVEFLKEVKAIILEDNRDDVIDDILNQIKSD